MVAKNKGKSSKENNKEKRAAAARAALGLGADSVIEVAKPAAKKTVNKVDAVEISGQTFTANGRLRQSRGSTEQETTTSYTTPPAHIPKKHPDGSLKIGDSVWYGAERFYVEGAPATWATTPHIRICDKPIQFDAHGRPMWERLTDKRNSFCVHADKVELAPPPVNSIVAPPTKRAVERSEARKKGEKDVGDPIAVMLRDAKTPDDVYKIGAKYLGVTVQELKDKYKHLNPGQQRMNVGNRMRAKWKKDNK